MMRFALLLATHAVLFAAAWAPVAWAPPRHISPRRPAALRAAPDDLSGLPRAELEELARRLTSENAALRRSVEAPRNSFSLGAASLCAGFAFESYNDPDGARWERGADGCDVAFRDASFVRSCYAGALIARVVEARGLEGQQDLQEIALTGSASDPYVRLAVVERSPRGSQRERASNATDVARTETVWRGGDNAVWPDNSHCLYVRDPAAASLAVRVAEPASARDRARAPGKKPRRSTTRTSRPTTTCWASRSCP